MCWTTKMINPQPKIAEKDIPIVKVLCKGKCEVNEKHYKWFSPFFYFPYKLNKKLEHKVNLKCIREDGITYICKGFHSFLLEKAIYNISFETFTINKTFSVDYFFDTEQYLLHGIIPKGSVYYVNENGEVVSNAIKIYRKQVKIFKKWKRKNKKK